MLRRFSLQLINTGVKVSAVTQLSISEISSTWNSDLQYSPVESCDRPIGAKARIAIAVAPSSGRAAALPLLGATVIAILAFAPIGLSQDSTGEYCKSPVPCGQWPAVKGARADDRF